MNLTWLVLGLPVGGWLHSVKQVILEKDQVGRGSYISEIYKKR